jgi:endonuclease YncB( thermonuclease family)
MKGTKEESIGLFASAPENVPMFNLAGVKTYARVVSVYDGDTVQAVMPFGEQFYRFSVRINGIDTCEIKSKMVANKALAIRARNRVIDLVTQGVWNGNENAKKTDVEGFLKKHVFVVWMECHDMDKYGRVLASLHSDIGTPSFADTLVQEKLAYVYSGNTKLTEEEQVKLLSEIPIL